MASGSTQGCGTGWSGSGDGSSRIPGRRRCGFTLVEILVATAIMALLGGLILLMTAQVLRLWTRSSGMLAAGAEARVAMDLLTQDLEAAYFRNDGMQWMRVEVDAAGPGGPYDGETVVLKFFTNATDRDPSAGGHLCGVAYRLTYKPAYPGGPDLYGLYRALAQPDETFGALLGSGGDGTAPQASLGEDTDAPSWFWNAASIGKEGNFLSANIAGFRVRVYAEEDPVPVNTDSDGSLVDYAFGGEGGMNRPLRAAEVSLTVLSDEGVRILENLAAGRSGTGYTDAADVVREHGQTFVRRVSFLARPL